MGDNIIIEDDVVIGNNVQLYGNIYLFSGCKIGDNCTIKSGAKIFRNAIIGKDSLIEENCCIKEELPNCSKVQIINEEQITYNYKKSYLPSQQMYFYGLYPKFKNGFVIIGEGFYNPNIIIKTKSKSLDYKVSYWDKNKIIVKIKNTTPLARDEAETAKIIILCRGCKLAILKSQGLIKTLCNLSS